MPEATPEPVCTGCYTGQCTSCNSCDSCNTSCQGTNACVACNTGCQNGCNTKQTYCVLGKETIALATGASFEFSPKPSTSVQMGPLAGMFGKDSWDAIATYISTRHKLAVTAKSNKPATVTSSTTTWVSTNSADGGAEVSASAEADVKPFTADEFNRISATLKMAAGTTATTVSKNQLIQASLFNNLASEASGSLVLDTACSKCNAGCDYGCDSCQNCNSGCQTCNSCDSCNASCQGTNNYTCGSGQLSTP